eukprot:3871670-Prorocentrum_lima.AAC.1
MEDDAWMSQQPNEGCLGRGHSNTPWPAWSEVERQEEDSLAAAAGERPWVPQPSEPSENLAGWHT